MKSKIVGSILIAIPFVALFLLTAHAQGIKTALEIFGATLGTVGLIASGTYFLVRR